MSDSLHTDDILVDLSEKNPLLPTNRDYETPTLSLISQRTDLILENPYTEIEVAPHTQIPISDQSGEDNSACLVCMFVVLFHVTRGHEIIWSLPEEIDLDGVEFKAVPSGMHTVERDFIYFRKAGLYGLSCYAKRAISSLEFPDQRGARMMSIGILCLSPNNLPIHINFLSTAIQNLLDSPTDFSSLAEYYNTYAYNNNNNNTNIANVSSLNVSMISSTNSGHDFAKFVQILGPSVFVLWKYLLIKSRVIFFSKPPIGPCCNWVYFSCLLTQNDVTKVNPNPHFYVSVADLDILKEETSFVACTTDQIIQIKRACYDVFIPVTYDNGIASTAKITCPGVMIKPVLFINSTDINRYRNLMKRCDRFRGALLDRDQLNLTCIQYFREITSNLFSHFSDYSQYESVINPHLLRRAGLDAYGDFTFLRFFCQAYNLKVELHRESEFSPFLCCSPRGSLL